MITAYLIGVGIFTIFALSGMFASAIEMETAHLRSEKAEAAKFMFWSIVGLPAAWLWPVLLIPALIWGSIHTYRIAYPQED